MSESCGMASQLPVGMWWPSDVVYGTMTLRGALTMLGGLESVNVIRTFPFDLCSHMEERSAYVSDLDSDGQSPSRSCRDKASPDSRNRMTNLCTPRLQLSVVHDISGSGRIYIYRTAQSRPECQSLAMACGSLLYHGNLKCTRKQKTQRNLGDCSGVLEIGHLGCPLSDMPSRLLQ